jgi:hypothetical protein
LSKEVDRENLKTKLTEVLFSIESFHFDEQYDNEELFTALNNLEEDIRLVLRLIANPKPNPFRVI